MEKCVEEFRGNPVIAICSSDMETGELVELSKSLSTRGEAVLLLARKRGIEERLLPAFANASLRIKDKMSRSRSLQMEMLLLACGTMNIGSALASCGIKSNEGFVVFATGVGVFSAFSRKAKLRVLRKMAPALNFNEAGRVAATELETQ